MGAVRSSTLWAQALTPCDIAFNNAVLISWLNPPSDVIAVVSLYVLLLITPFSPSPGLCIIL